MKLLVIEDDSILNNILCYNLIMDGHRVDSAYSVESARNYIKTEKYTLVILDVNLPDGNGFELCKEIKQKDEEVAIIFLTANDMESDMMKGFELGADDYVTKPFPISVFQKKVYALIGRLTKQIEEDIYDDGTLKINFSRQSAVLMGEPISFTALEYRLLRILIKNENTCLTRSLLLEKLWDIDENFVEEHALTSAISRLRSKLEKSGHEHIKTIYGMGYLWIGGIKHE